MVTYNYIPWYLFNPAPRANYKICDLDPSQKVLWDSEWFGSYYGGFHPAKKEPEGGGAYSVLYADQSVGFVPTLAE